MKWLRTALLRWHYKHMSEFGRELADEFRDPTVSWHLGEYVLTHKPSGIQLWIRNGCAYVHIHELPKSSYGDSALKTILNFHDKRVLWACYQSLAMVIEARPAKAALNILRLSKHKENQS